MHEIITKRADGSRRVSLHLPTDSHVEQTHVGSTNINAIMRKYRRTGELPQPRNGGQLYGDFAMAEDFHTAQNRLVEAEEQFMALPSDLRGHFRNDPGLFFEYVNNPDNLEECQNLGLIALEEEKVPRGPSGQRVPQEHPPPPQPKPDDPPDTGGVAE